LVNRTIHNPVQGDTATFLETATDTGGARTLISIRVTPGGGGPPVHFHNEFDEEIVAIDGPLQVTLGKRKMLLQPGERVMVPKGTPHTWCSASQHEVTFEARMVPATPGFENVLRVLYGMAQEGKLNRAGLPKDLTTFALLARWGDTNLPGAMGFLNPIMGWLAKRGERSGLGDRLRQRYACEVPEPVMSSATGAIPD
jgi:quercetin dioxygenase-like cupin family protein